jgi:hypothetical protein
MTTVRSLTAKLNFNVDTSQAEKFQRVIRDTNQSLQAVKTSKIVKDTGKVVRALKKMRTAFKKKLDTTKVGKSLNSLSEKTAKFKTKVKSLRESIKKMREAFREKIESTAFGKGIKKISDSMTKLVNSAKKVGRVFKIGGLKKKINAWMKGAAAAVKNKSKKVLSNIKKFADKINLKANLVRSAMAALAATTASVVMAASKESAETRVLGLSGEGGVEKLKENYSKIRKLSKGLFDEGDIAKAGAAFLEVNNNIEAMNKLMPVATKLAVIHGKDLGEVMTQLGQFTVTGSEESLKNLGLYNEREIELIKKQGKEASQFTNTQKLQTLYSQVGKKKGQIDPAFQKSFGDTSTKFKQLTGTAKQGALEFGESGQASLNKDLDRGRNQLKRFINFIKTPGAGTFMDFMMERDKIPVIQQNKGGSSSTMDNRSNNQTFHISVTTENEAAQAEKIKSVLSRDIKAAYYTQTGLNPIKQGANQ